MTIKKQRLGEIRKSMATNPLLLSVSLLILRTYVYISWRPKRLFYVIREYCQHKQL
jgi:hypothetical protein